jgi:transcriptional regulator with XRE-family HTH domain
VITPGTIGTRIRYWRLRRNGMTQSVLAGLAGVSQSYISQVESGRKSVDSRSTLVAVAAALKVTVADLLGQPGDPTDPLKAGAADAVPAIWAALIEIEEGERRRPTWAKERLADAVGRAARLRTRSDYPTMAGLLPDLLIESAASGGVALARAGYEASVCLRNLGYRHLSLPAARIAVAAAQEAAHPAWIGATRRANVWALPVEASAVADRAVTRTLTDLQAKAAVPNVREMLGMLHLSAALVCATEGRADDARAHIAEASREATALGDPVDGVGFNEACFGPTNVGLWAMAVAAELHDYGRVVELAREARPSPLREAGRHHAYWLTLGRALAHSGRRDQEAMAAFMRAERAAPVLFALNPQVRDTVVSMVNRARRRSVSEDLRILARRIGIEA